MYDSYNDHIKGASQVLSQKAKPLRSFITAGLLYTFMPSIIDMPGHIHSMPIFKKEKTIFVLLCDHHKSGGFNLCNIWLDASFPETAKFAAVKVMDWHFAIQGN